MAGSANSSRPRRVPVHGVLLLDKPAGHSSTQALAQAKRLLNAQKGGHVGTLDPFATGLLPLCFGEATKYSADLIDADKTYDTTVRLGVTTTTGDTEGDILEQRPVDCDRGQIEQVLAKFRGPIEQIPPMHSALKRDGKPLYQYAREGITLERAARPVTIHSLELCGWQRPLLTLRVHCSKGTYIRALGEDIGAALGCGAHLQQLRRTAVGALSIDNAVTLDRFAAMSPEERSVTLAPVDALLASLASIDLDGELAARFVKGQRLQLADKGWSRPQQAMRVRVYADDGRFLGSAHFHPHGVLAPERVVATGSPVN